METNVKKIPQEEFWKIINGWLLSFDLRPAPPPKKCYSKGMHRTIKHIPMASNRKRSRGRIKAYDMGQGEGPTLPIQTDASEESDSYFRLMTIKHSISKIQCVIVWALNNYLTQLSSSPRSSCQEGSRQLETRCGKESHTRPRGPSENPVSSSEYVYWKKMIQPHSLYIIHPSIYLRELFRNF